MNVRSLSSLTLEEITDMANRSAERGELLPQANPFAPSCWRHQAFSAAFQERIADLQPVG